MFTGRSAAQLPLSVLLPLGDAVAITSRKTPSIFRYCFSTDPIWQKHCVTCPAASLVVCAVTSCSRKLCCVHAAHVRSQHVSNLTRWCLSVLKTFALYFKGRNSEFVSAVLVHGRSAVTSCRFWVCKRRVVCRSECSGRSRYLKLLLHVVEGWEPIFRPYPFLKICTVYLATIISCGAVFLVTQPIEIILIPYITLSFFSFLSWICQTIIHMCTTLEYVYRLKSRSCLYNGMVQKEWWNIHKKRIWILATVKAGWDTQE
jgi:hypothetical protein